MFPASGLPLATGARFTQPGVHFLADPCSYFTACMTRGCDISILSYSLFERKSFTSYSCIGHVDLLRESSPLFVCIAVSPSVGNSKYGLVFLSGLGRCRVGMTPNYWSFFTFFSIPIVSTAMQDSSQVTITCKTSVLSELNKPCVLSAFVR